ncbi:hypothetical protein ACTFQF_14510 [Aliivibrio fischeri]|uniref:hypothetical protein n=1 Tax=Aliivibrio fischeri TaxID=668 RepID=UPI003F75775D
MKKIYSIMLISLISNQTFASNYVAFIPTDDVTIPNPDNTIKCDIGSPEAITKQDLRMMIIIVKM